jgi:hypothetical protein
MPDNHKELFKKYCNEIKDHWASEVAGELTYRSALETYINGFGNDIRARNEAAVDRTNGSRKKNKPDFLIERKNTPIGYIETKNIGVPLDELISNDPSSQFQRYSKAYANLIITDYLEFRRYVRGDLRSKTQIGKTERKKGVVFFPDASKELKEFFDEFLLEEAYSVSSPGELASRLAHLTRQVKRLVADELKVEEESARLQKLLVAFRKILIADMNVEKFADMFAQTLAYGFFAARVHYDGKGEFSRRTASAILPKTNPFLKKIFSEFANDSLPETLVTAVDDIVDLLNKTDIGEVLKHFGGRGRQDPVVHFYESFLAAYDPKLKKSMGVFFTPDPVVSYIVNSVDEILVDQFNRKKGLADDKTWVLDPALGTGSFLSKVTSVIFGRIQKGSWNSYVANSLLERLFGFEILMAPYAVAHLNLGLQLKQSGYQFVKEQRLGIFLTNTLEETAKRSEALFADWLSEEANAAARVKRELPIMVVLGNPPYSGISANKNSWIEGLLKGFDEITKKIVASYFKVDGIPINEKKHWLNDDYVKFIRFGQWRIEQTGHGILALITNHGFLDNPTFRGMRQALLSDFDDIYIIDLHGNSKKKEVSPDGSKDENVFDIQQGVSICFMVKNEGVAKSKANNRLGTVHRCDLWGSRAKKYEWLNQNTFRTTKFKKVGPRTPFYTFTQQNHALGDEYNIGKSLISIFPTYNTGMVTACDNLSIQFSKEAMWETVKSFANKAIGEAREKWDLGGNRDWSIEWAQKDLKESGLKKELIKGILYRPFDMRWTYFTGKMKGFVCNPRPAIMQHMLSRDNIALVSARSNKSPTMDHFFATNLLMEVKAGESTTGSAIFPLFLRPTDSKSKVTDLNLSEEAKEYIIAMTGKCDSEGARAFFHYVYAICHSPTFRTRYAELIKMDYPRIQFTSDKSLFKQLSKLGDELVGFHLLKDGRLDGGKTDFPKKGDNRVSTVKYDSKTNTIHINKTQSFTNVHPDDYHFTVGGYQVLEKWLRYRKGHTLEYRDISEFEKIVEAIRRTRASMQKIDEVIAEHGNWPIESSEKSKKKAA